MDDLLTHLVKQIVENPKEVEVLVDESQNSNDITLIIDSNPDDVPLIIGRKGRTIKALRNIIGILALKEQKRAHLTVKHQKPYEGGMREASNEDGEEAVEVPAAKKRPVKKAPRKAREASISQEETQDVLGF